MKHNYPKYFFIDDNGVKHHVYDDFSSTFPKPFAVYQNTVEVMDGQGFVTGEFVLHTVNEQVAA